MKIRLLFILFFVLQGFCAFSQTGWGAWQKLYKDNNITVEIKFFIAENSCVDGEKPLKFKYQLNGYLTSYTQFVNWKMDYTACNGELTYVKNSIAIGGKDAIQLLGENKLIDNVFVDQDNATFTCIDLVEPFYDAVLSKIKATGSGNRIIPLSKEPIGIEGNKNIYLGQSTDLTVEGGMLGLGADWVWYKDQCGSNKVGTGETITVQPTDTSTYFVRAEGKNNKTLCAQLTINVNKKSTSPTSISGNAKACRGENTILTVEGGSLGLESDWVWYINSCKGQKLGKGISISVNPTESTTYLVRAEGKYNKTDCVSILINVYNKSLDPTSITTITSTTICEGEKIKLRVNGGLLSNGAVWKWYSGSCDESSIASGLEVELAPLSSTTFFVRGEGFCNKTNCVSVVVSVNEKSYSAGYITKPSIIYKYQKITLSLNGGSLGKNSRWVWWKGYCEKGKIVGTGTSITVRNRKPTTYFVQARGLCNETTCIEAFVKPVKMHHWNRTYSSAYKKFLHIGLGLGLEWTQLPVIAQFSTIVNGKPTINNLETTVSINGLGLKGEIPFYPFMKEYLSLGFIPAYSIGISPSFLTSDLQENSTSISEENYFYQRYQLETEFACGFKPVKFLAKWKRGFQSNDYQKILTTNSNYKTVYTFKENINQETISAGIRLGRYAHKQTNKRGNSFDFIYTLSRNRPEDILSFSSDSYNTLKKWNVGAGFSWWRQSAFKFQFDVDFTTNQQDFDFNSIKFNGATYQISLIYNRNWFY